VNTIRIPFVCKKPQEKGKRDPKGCRAVLAVLVALSFAGRLL
jgi:hypothetical protein